LHLRLVIEKSILQFIPNTIAKQALARTPAAPRRLVDHSVLLGKLATSSRDFH
jgi:hypothetical protein